MTKWGDYLITKAVIPAAGLGTRMLPLTKTQPKEMLPIGSKPCLQYIVEELASVGIKDILIITGQRKRVIEDHFDKDHYLESLLQQSGQKELLETLQFDDMGLRFFFTRQSQAKGLGDAISLARSFVNNEPFVIALGDSIIHSMESKPLLERMTARYYNNPNSIVIATREVPIEDVSKYGIVKIKPENQLECEIEDVVEKPSPKTTPSTLAFAARYVVPPIIFDALDRTSPGKGGEIQLTDAIRILLREGVKGYSEKLTVNEKRYDIGNMSSYFEAFIDFALVDEKYGYQLKQYLYRKLNL